MFFNRNQCASLPMEKAALELENNKNIHLIDVRSPEEYRAGHIPNSLNLPLENVAHIARHVADKDARIFVYCLSGGRSQAACAQLTRLGYTQVVNIGGIGQWRGKIERSVSA